MLNIRYWTWSSPPQLIQVCFVRFLKASCHVGHPSYRPELCKCGLETETYLYPLQMVSHYITLAFFGFLDSGPPSSKVSRLSKSIASRSRWRVFSNSLSHLPPSAPSNNHTWLMNSKRQNRARRGLGGRRESVPIPHSRGTHILLQFAGKIGTR